MVDGQKVSADVDVVGGAGEFVSVGGQSKGGDALGAFGDATKRLNQVAGANGVKPVVAIENLGDVTDVVRVAKKQVGADNVLLFDLDVTGR